MKLPVFTESKFCQSRKHCGICREREDAKGEQWRTMHGQRFKMPEGAPDFVCPVGVPWRDEKTVTPRTVTTPRKSCGRCSRAAKRSKGA